MRRRRVSLAAVLLTLAGAAYAWIFPLDSADVTGGLPRAESFWVRLTTHTLQNPGFVIGYSEWRRNPLWVAYRATPIQEAGSVKRPDHFNVDRRTLMRVSADDYRGTDYDRGHLAPNYIISRLYGPQAQQATFQMSNISPQTRRLNQLLWQRLEEAEANVVTPRVGTLWVVTGPIFGSGQALTSGVEIPVAFYRIWFDADRHHALGFRVPQTVCGDEPLSDFLVSVDVIEQQTGLDFFRDYDDALESRFESQTEAPHWNVASFARAPARYASKFRGPKCRSKP